jgi:hypothetical protein
MNKEARAGFGLMALTALAVVVHPTTAITETEPEMEICGPRADVVAQLDGQFAESQKAIGLLGEEAVMEVFVSDHGSWTILTTDVNGVSCLVAAGEGWDDTIATTVGQRI